MARPVFYFLAFLLGMGLVLGYRYYLTARQPVFRPEATAFALQPPSQSLAGTLTVTRGTAQKLARDADEYAEASSGADIVQGESVAVDAVSTAEVEIPDMVTVQLQQLADITFANLFPDNMLLRQKGGTASYATTGVHLPISVRVQHALVAIASGITDISLEGSVAAVTVRSGAVKLALVDAHNDTHVYDLSAGQTVRVDDQARTVVLLPPR